MIFDAVMTMIYQACGGFVDLLPGGEAAPSWVAESFGYLFSVDALFPLGKVSAFVGTVASIEMSLLLYALMSKMWSRQ